MLALKAFALWTCVFFVRQNIVDAVECDEMTLIYHTNSLRALENCTSILGSLIIMSMSGENGPNRNINTYQFPKLK